MRIAIVGARGHGKVVADAVLASGTDELLGFLDDNAALHGRTHFGYPVLGPTDTWRACGAAAAVVGVGDNATRKRLFEQLKAAGAEFATVVHPSATIGREVILGEGAVVLANVAINSDTRIGANSILNTASSVDHDCLLGDHVHVAPGARIAGEVRLGDGVFVGTGAIIVPRISVGDWAVIGAGAVVLNNGGGGVKLVGVPAKEI